MFLKTLKYLRSTIKSPPCWIWFSNGKAFRRISSQNLFFIFLEIIQQLNWSIFNLLKIYFYKKKSNLKIKNLFLLSVLNSYTYSELDWMKKHGVQDYKSISKILPNNKSNYIHKINRKKWPNQCKDSISLLAKKSDLLSFTPAKWRSKFILWSKNSKNPFFFSDNWIRNEIQNNGIIIKPNIGFGSQGIIFYKYKKNYLEEIFLFNEWCTNNNYYFESLKEFDFKKIWNFKHFYKNKKALIMPYYENIKEFPSTFPSVTLRVITTKDSISSEIKISHSWLDIPLSNSKYIFLNLDGKYISRHNKEFNIQETKKIDVWQDLIKDSIPECIKECLEGSIFMHNKLHNIDKVAWDWIPQYPKPILLEGNSGFGIFMQELFDIII